MTAHQVTSHLVLLPPPPSPVARFKPERMTLPPPSLAQAWREGAADGAWPGRDWWRGFGSEELDLLIAKAERNNEDLAAAIARVREADAQARIAGATLLPAVTVSTEAAAVRRHNGSGKERHYGDFIGAFTASYEFDIWGKNHAALQAAKSSPGGALRPQRRRSHRRLGRGGRLHPDPGDAGRAGDG